MVNDPEVIVETQAAFSLLSSDMLRAALRLNMGSVLEIISRVHRHLCSLLLTLVLIVWTESQDTKE